VCSETSILGLDGQVILKRDIVNLYLIEAPFAKEFNLYGCHICSSSAIAQIIRRWVNL
jgi:hypothetical protein